ncbi:MAG: phage tail protein [Variovorax sp.]
MTRKPSRSGAKEPLSQRPCGNGNFLVDLGMGDARAPAAGFCEVVFPEFVLPPQQLQEAGDVLPAPAGNAHLVLRRAATGALDLYQWWQLARVGGKPPPRRTVTVELLGPDLASTLMRWRFLKASPVGLAYSPLNALAPGLLFETLTLAFAGVEMELP